MARPCALSFALVATLGCATGNDEPLAEGGGAGIDASQNDDDSHYCAAVTPLASGDKGTPGAANDPCP